MVGFTSDKFTEKEKNATKKNNNQAILFCIVMFSITDYCKKSFHQSAPAKKRIKLETVGWVQLLCVVKKQTLEVELGIPCCCSGKRSPKCIHFTGLLKGISRWVDGIPLCSHSFIVLLDSVYAWSFLSFLSCFFGKQTSVKTLLHHISGRFFLLKARSLCILCIHQ